MQSFFVAYSPYDCTWGCEDPLTWRVLLQIFELREFFLSFQLSKLGMLGVLLKWVLSITTDQLVCKGEFLLSEVV